MPLRTDLFDITALTAHKSPLDTQYKAKHISKNALPAPGETAIRKLLINDPCTIPL